MALRCSGLVTSTRRHLRLQLSPSLSPLSRSCSSSSDFQTLMDETVLQHLVCPISKYPLRYDATRNLLICGEIRVAYPIRHGVPLLIPSEGRLLREDEDI